MKKKISSLADGDHSGKGPGVGPARGNEIIEFGVVSRIMYCLVCQITGTGDPWAEVLASRCCGQDKETNGLLREWVNYLA